MVDPQAVDEILPIGEVSSASPTLVSGPKSPAASTHASVNHQADSGHEDGQKHDEHKEHDEHDGNVDQPAMPISEAVDAGAKEHRSPVPSTNFSEAPTLLTRESTYTANTGGRAHQSWRGGITNFWHPSGRLTPNDAIASNASSAREDSAVSSITDISSADPDPIELPAAPVARPDEPRSFFESDSESEGDTIIRTASRASSLRGERPRLVQHQSSNNSLRRTRFYQSALLAPPRNPGPSHSKAEQILGTKLTSLLDLTSAPESSGPSAPLDDNTAGAFTALPADRLEEESATAPLELTLPSRQRSYSSSLVIEVPNTPSRAEALDTLPTPFGGFGSLRLSRPISSRLGVSPLDALRSHPVTHLDTVGLHRASSAPPLPYRRNRKVTIRPVDLEVIHSAQGKGFFRDSVVSTPYPTRHHSMSGPDNPQTPTSPINGVDLPLPTKDEASKKSPTTSRVEILTIELSLARPARATTVLTIPIHDRGTFDDRALFTTLRHTYHHTLLGLPTRLLNARTLSHATFSFPTHPFNSSTTRPPTIPFDPTSFLTHLSSPQSGHRRKTWLQWFRKHQPSHHHHNNRSTPTSHLNRSGSDSSAPYFSPDGIPRTPAFVDPRPPPSPPQQQQQSNAPSLAVSPTDSHSDSASSASTMAVARITLHHSFSLRRIAVAVGLVVFLTIITTVLWVLFGRPGVGVGVGSHAGGVNGVGMGVEGGDVAGMGSMGGGGGGDWRVAAQGRVLTGMVMGLLVFLMGCFGTLGWVGGSWAVL